MPRFFRIQEKTLVH